MPVLSAAKKSSEVCEASRVQVSFKGFRYWVL